jgi:hypothetical protein
LPIFDGSRLSHFYIVNFTFPYNVVVYGLLRVSSN